MSYSSIAHDLIFRSVEQGLWETYPYKSGIGGAGDLHFFKRPEPGLGSFDPLYRGKIPKNFVKLNIRDRLKEFYPNEYPNMDTIGYAVREILKECKVNNYIAAEDRGWEGSDYWATLEAIFIRPKDYEIGILTKVKSSAEKVLNGNKREIEQVKKECVESPPIKKQKIESTSQDSPPEFECPNCKQLITKPIKIAE